MSFSLLGGALPLGIYTKIPPNAFHSYGGEAVHPRPVDGGTKCASVPRGSPHLPGVLRFLEIDLGRFRQLSYDSPKMKIKIIFEFVA
jgi:hypothetical protein